MARYKDITGERFGRLFVKHYLGIGIDKKALWLCKCDCGDERAIAGDSLRLGRTQSCGCLQKQITAMRSTTHGMRNTRTYKIWTQMHKRCSNPNSSDFAHYGGRGIRIAQRWNKFEYFLKDMGECPDGYSIERINNNGNYCKSNCRWIPISRQQCNTSRTRWVVTPIGRMCLADAARVYCIPHTALRNRLKAGWTVRKALLTPLRSA